VSRRDVAAGLLVLAAVAAWVLGGAVWSTSAGVRGTAALVLALGVAAAVVGGGWVSPVPSLALRAPGALGLLAALAGVAALVTGSAAALRVLVLLTVALWGLATLRHVSGPR
jgi:hypothetical protein